MIGRRGTSRSWRRFLGNPTSWVGLAGAGRRRRVLPTHPPADHAGRSRLFQARAVLAEAIAIAGAPFMAYQTINPFDGSVVQTFQEFSDSELASALDSAADCFAGWRQTSFAERAAIAHKAAGLLREQSGDYARLITLEMGKRIEEAEGEVALSADIIDYYADHAEAFLKPQPLKPESGEAVIESSPLGVLFGVQPWNFPYYQLARFAAPNLMAGNVVMVKHAGCVPQCAQAFEKLWRDAGAPAGAYTNLVISYDQVNAVIDDPRIKGVALTGSADAGKSVAARAGQNLKKSTMELGGSDAFIVLEDADLDKTVEWAVWGKMNNMGQCCVAAKRFLVVDSLADRFLEKFQAALAGLKAGDPMDRATTLAPLSTEGALTKLVEQVDKAVSDGATLVMGGKRLDRPGFFMEPTILTDIAPDTAAFREEFFGPVALFFRVKDEDEAVALANDSDFGLGGSVFTQDVARGKRVAERIETGMVFINQPTWTAPDLPFGGINISGYGRELSGLGIQEFVNKKLVRVALIDAAA
ncbi:aldehyde dehydrogenase [Rhodospirillum rubrum F11]|uniref:Aldehyde dehydrogenase n=2 Tax=Rhodospirillum rubrum TaxID=1085 RepID=Q2RX78_RHORT|nr:Aldehyde dehydrogenase [Rhodospirillum rubrum ATCC 11170]AEO46945.1 aldehyde dehydrogenase [Rhodospirillum rubrum F11]MBK5952821.1 aldehyde dehydrogenase [Rhodospirillum rubrum]